MGSAFRCTPFDSHIVLLAPVAGKTAFLRALTGRHPTGGSSDPRPGHADWSARVTYSGCTSRDLAKHGVALSRLAAFLPQDDTFEPLLTVKETLNFAHALYSPRPLEGSADLPAWSRRVDTVIADLGLTE